MWTKLGLNIAQNPKAHLLFDGHLIEQVRLYGGLADKADDEIERAHQIHGKLDKLTCNLKNYERRNDNQQRAVYRRANPVVNKQLNWIGDQRKRNFKDSTNKRSRADLAREVKNEKRAKVLSTAGDSICAPISPILT